MMETLGGDGRSPAGCRIYPIRGCFARIKLKTVHRVRLYPNRWATMLLPDDLPRYDIEKPYQWNYEHSPDAVDVEVPAVPGTWRYCGLPVDSPLGVPAGPLLDGRWCLYYASLGFDVLTYKTVRSVARACFPLPNLQPVACGALHGGERRVPACDTMRGSWAVSFGMPSQSPEVWREDIKQTRGQLPSGKLLSVSVVGTQQPGWELEQLAEDYARCARWAVESGADCIETNFSCPNVATPDAQLFQQPDDARIVATHVRQAIGRTPYIAKVGHVPSREAATRLMQALAPQVDALAMTNSVATTVQAADGQLLFGGQARGICGNGVREASIEQTRMFSQLIDQLGLDIQLVGVGGVCTAEHVRAYLSAGAHAVHIASAAMVDPRVGIRIRRQLASCKENRRR